MVRIPMRLLVCGMLSLAAGVTAHAEVQQVVVTSYTNDDAKPWTRAFKPILEAEQRDRKPDPAHPEQVDVTGMQLERLRSGRYLQLLVKVQTQRLGERAISDSATTRGVLPAQEGDRVSLATCAPLNATGDFVILQMTYVHEQGKWMMDSRSYQQVDQCAAAAALLDKAGDGRQAQATESGRRQ